MGGKGRRGRRSRSQSLARSAVSAVSSAITVDSADPEVDDAATVCSNDSWGVRWLASPVPEERDTEARQSQGTIGVLSGNWGGNRKNPSVDLRVRLDLRKTPAQILLLQEAQPGLVDWLNEPVAETEEAEASTGPALVRARRQVQDPPSRAEQAFQRRSQSQFIAQMIEDPHAENTLLIACRSSHCKEITIVQQVIRDEGLYKDGDRTRRVYSRIAVCDVTFVRPMAGRRRLRLMNCHLNNVVATKTRRLLRPVGELLGGGCQAHEGP
jgi:hypothetical protein